MLNKYERLQEETELLREELEEKLINMELELEKMKQKTEFLLELYLLDKEEGKKNE